MWSKDQGKYAKEQADRAKDMADNAEHWSEQAEIATQDAGNAALYIDEKKPLIEKSISDAAEALVKSMIAENSSALAEEIANKVKREFDQIVADAGGNNPEVVQARGEYINLNARLDDFTDMIDGGVFGDTTTGVPIDGGEF